MTTFYILAALAIAGTVTFALRALPTLFFERLHNSRFFSSMAVWMPAGILTILVGWSAFSTMRAEPGFLLPTIIASATTVIVHIFCGRRTLLSDGAGTLCFVLLVNIAF